MISGKTRLYGLFGYPVKHTFSPAMHNAGFAKIGRDACYLPFEVPPSRLADAVASIRALGLQGINVTVPHKEKIIPYLDGLAEEAQLIGAVNTVVVRDERLIGHNTDGRGFIRSLRESARFKPNGKRFLIVGSGGAGRAVGFSLAAAGAREVYFHDVDRIKAQALVNDIVTKTGMQGGLLSADELVPYAREADCVINATPMGLKRSDRLPIPLEGIRSGQVVCDLVYNPPKTRLLQAAQKRGAKPLPGIGMLLYQAVIAFELWTGKGAPIQTMKSALLRQIRVIS